jgi:hypothetical protein
MICNNFSLFTFFHTLPSNRVLLWPWIYGTPCILHSRPPRPPYIITYCNSILQYFTEVGIQVFASLSNDKFCIGTCRRIFLSVYVLKRIIFVRKVFLLRIKFWVLKFLPFVCGREDCTLPFVVRISYVQLVVYFCHVVSGSEFHFHEGGAERLCIILVFCFWFQPQNNSCPVLFSAPYCVFCFITERTAFACCGRVWMHVPADVPFDFLNEHRTEQSPARVWHIMLLITQ